MSALEPSVSRWAAIVRAELARAKLLQVLPVNFVLSLIQQESGGRPGRVANEGAGDGSHASGLMQVIGSTLAGYNTAHPSAPVLLAEMRGTSTADAAKQIRVGVWVFSRERAKAISWLAAHSIKSPDWKDVLRLADTGYARGWGHTEARLEKLAVSGGDFSWERFAEAFPDPWDGTRNRPIFHASRIWERFKTAELEHPSGEGYSPTLEEAPERPFPPMLTTWLIALLFAVVLASVAVFALDKGRGSACAQ